MLGLVRRSHSNGLISANRNIGYRWWRLPKHCIDSCAPRPQERTPIDHAGVFSLRTILLIVEQCIV